MSGPLLVVGDFNHQPNSTVMTSLFNRTSLASALDVLDPKWNLTNIGAAPISYRGNEKIDYVLYRGLKPVAAGTMPSQNSDHYLVWADFVTL